MPITEEGYRYIEGNLLSENEQLRTLLSRLAQGEVMSASDDMGGVIYMCSHCVPNEEYEHDAGKHESDCPIMLARKMLEIRANK